MTETLPPCPKCASPFCYQLDGLITCPECGHEWSAAPSAEETAAVRDSVGNLLSDGDRLVDGDHDIDCKVPGIGQIGLKSQFVKKVTG